MKTLSQDEWKKGVETDENAEILDVRTPEEFEEGAIPDAKLVDIQDPGNFMNSINKLDKSKSYYVYCRTGGRSNQACQVMDQLGFKNTYNLEGGIKNWEGEKK